MPESDRPKDRTCRRKEKPPARVVSMKLELDLVDAIEQMGEDLHYEIHGAIRIALFWAVWAHSCGRSPFTEMMKRPGGFTAWDEKIRARRETRELTRLYEISGEESFPHGS